MESAATVCRIIFGPHTLKIRLDQILEIRFKKKRRKGPTRIRKRPIRIRKGPAGISKRKGPGEGNVNSILRPSTPVFFLLAWYIDTCLLYTLYVTYHELVTYVILNQV